jgi:2-oxoglutarate ferredoxin oxidoreductase subunit delta
MGVDAADMKLWRTPFDQAEKATKPGKVLINKERCKGCGYCVEFCPRGALMMSEELSPKGYYLAAVADESKCLGCGLCEVICPEFAIRLASNGNED